jgi:hypothetical protein
MPSGTDFDALALQPLLQISAYEGDLQALSLPPDLSMREACATMEKLQAAGTILKFKPLPAPAHGFLVLRPPAASVAAAGK